MILYLLHFVDSAPNQRAGDDSSRSIQLHRSRAGAERHATVYRHNKTERHPGYALELVLDGDSVLAHLRVTEYEAPDDLDLDLDVYLFESDAGDVLTNNPLSTLVSAAEDWAKTFAELMPESDYHRRHGSFEAEWRLLLY